jgi:hypothetical protein
MLVVLIAVVVLVAVIVDHVFQVRRAVVLMARQALAPAQNPEHVLTELLAGLIRAGIRMDAMVLTPVLLVKLVIHLGNAPV